MKMRRRVSFTLLLTLAALLLSPAIAQGVPKSTKISITGSHGEILTVSKTLIASGSAIRVTGSRFDETVGIYLAFCVVPKRGEVPTPCGGGINQEGIGDASHWISSNPPSYGIGTAREYLPGGRFSYVMHISSKFGKVDCRKVRCAITVRADHTRNTDRGYDIFVPIKFKP